ncbi:hypothetical protein [Paenibacillus sp. PAMC21692]|uniref:hypothetical protein n=1 Tax=Paenibacillus sp. PAMC21692 TaxID=2762320 RepID=UPI00164EB172|nr:hypothetical protein [Paenibacillus sp. PAMC21692]QNK54553.1 hypothetical protein H7F31_17990 [Paenibacillus sp. PAMC21692]
MSYDIPTYYDEDTGESLMLVDSQKYSVMSHEEIDAIRESRRRQKVIDNAGSGRSYVVSYHEPIRKLNEILTLNEIGVIMKLIPYMRFDRAGELMDGKRRMGIDEIMKAIGKSRRWTVELVGNLARFGVLVAERSGKRNVYNVHESYHTIGSTVETGPFTRVYQTKTRADIANVSIQAAGLLYKMIPYIHYHYLYLCCNPNVRKAEDILHLSQNRFAAEVGVDDDTASRGMQELIRAGFVMRSEAFGARIIRMNPDVMFRKRPRKEYDDYTEFVRQEFRQAARASVTGDAGEIEIDTKALPY